MVMRSFKEIALEEAAYNYDIDGDGNPYKDLDKAKLKKKEKAFNDQIADLRYKVEQSVLGSGGNRKEYFKEIEELQLKLDQVKYVLGKPITRKIK